MKSKEVVIENENGLHLRVAAAIVESSRKYKSRVVLTCENCPKAEACSIMQLLLLNGNRGKTLTIKSEGPDEERALEEISSFFCGGSGI
jgi:phosphotransferase system HPr (HPr) family protein